ncbi:two component transcriptional regulator, LytTR family [Caldalkalibacillus thermarum TA2.A1]|uniref:LytTR family DNA-binding domain-containing protein n=1 Tax=Caldalkalibacillus thermarum (strain TA2.A1) TaxID=986075 RepID=F5L693_CALTT|nr:LytTR family DNA-binding domain-containing protein [Caldalkalibacillus thermarum]EGL83143.1 two component transcriptional regulator, LytTR family [Caldalkalibacillus thermarum TA2.A1]QZT34841.1 LytTR family DNA-binding domain-containing protein [Caldalkalibacillus thermarum TA2.A1]
MSIKVMIAEDEKLAREELAYLLSRFSDLELVASVSNGKEVLEQLEQTQPDVVFLDIQMPELEGMFVAKQLRARKEPPLIVFTTAYDHYAVEAFRLQAIDYLLKPYNEERLEEAVNRIRTEIKHRRRQQTQQSPSANGSLASADHPQRVGKLLIDDGERMAVVDPASILYVVREDRQLKIHTATKTYTSKLTLQELEEKLSPYNFFRPHRSYLVNLNYVQEITPWFNGAYNLTLEHHPKTKIPVSRTAAKELLKRLQI